MRRYFGQSNLGTTRETQRPEPAQEGGGAEVPDLDISDSELEEGFKLFHDSSDVSDFTSTGEDEQSTPPTKPKSSERPKDKKSSPSSSGDQGEGPVIIGGKFISHVKDHQYWYISGGVALAAIIGFTIYKRRS